LQGSRNDGVTRGGRFWESDLAGFQPSRFGLSSSTMLALDEEELE
jgi:hypothetical protein